MNITVEIINNINDIDLDRIVKLIGNDPEIGAVSLYVGLAKGLKNGKKVRELRYLEDESSIKLLEESVNKAINEINVKKVYVIHCKGVRKNGDRIMIVAVGAKGRKEAFEATRRIVDEIKRTEPLKKIEVLE